MVAIRSRASCFSLSNVSSSKAISLRTPALLRLSSVPTTQPQMASPRSGRATARARHTQSAQHIIFLEPGLHLVPAILGGFLAVAGAVVGMKAVRRARIDLELGS